MANDLRESNAAANAAMNARVDLLNSGKLRIYDGTRPATVDTAVSTQTLLAELTLGNPAFGDASDGVATAEAITKDSAANATGTAAWFRVVTSADAAMFDGTVGTTGCDLNLASTSIVQNVEVSITSFTLTQPKAAS